MEKFEFTTEYFLEISQKCRYNERMAEWYRRMADLEYDTLFPLGARDEDRLFGSPDLRKVESYCSRARNIELCMKTGWLSNYYRMQGVKVVQTVNRCRDRFCYNCQSQDALTRFHEYAPLIHTFSKKYDIYHCVFTQPNVPGFILNATLDLMQKSFSRLVGFLSGKKKIRGLDLVGAYGFVGGVRALEVAKNDADSNYHPHYHCMLILKKGIDVTPRHRNSFSRDRTHQREDRLFSDFEIFLQRIWYLLLNGIKVTKDNLENLPQCGNRTYPDGFSCFAEKAEGRYHEIFKYVTKGSYKNGSILTDFECFRVLYVALFRRRVYQTFGCLYGIDMNEVHEGLKVEDPADICFQEIVSRLDQEEVPVTVVETLTEILNVKVPEEGQRGVKYISATSVRTAYDNTPEDERPALKDKIMSLIWHNV